MADAKQIIKRYNIMKAERGTLESHLQEVAELVLPRSSNFNVKRDKGEKLMTKVFDSEAITANELLASSLVGLNINPASKWFGANTEGMSDEAKKWLDKVIEVMLSAINAPRSKFYTAHFEFFIELCGLGTAGVFITDGKNGSGIRCQARSLTEFVIGGNPEDDIDKVYRRFEWPAETIHEKWGENSGKSVLKAMEAKKFNQKFHIIHAIQPRTDRDSSKKDTKNLPFQEVLGSICITGPNASIPLSSECASCCLCAWVTWLVYSNSNSSGRSSGAGGNLPCLSSNP